MRTCCCDHGWCDMAREGHFLGTSTVRFPSEASAEWSEWCVHLAVEESTVRSIRQPRVAISHFHDCDVICALDGDGTIRFCRLEEVTVFKVNTGNSSLCEFPRPTVTKANYLNSYYRDLRDCSYESYVAAKNGGTMYDGSDSAGTVKRKRSSPAAHSISPGGATLLSPPPSAKAFRETTFVSPHSGICEATLLVILCKQMIQHTSRCGGDLLFRNDRISTNGFMLNLVIRCSLGQQCKMATGRDVQRGWTSGRFGWSSSRMVTICGVRMPIVNLKFAFGISAASAPPAATIRVLRCMMLTPPSDDAIRLMNKRILDPFVIQEKEAVIARNMRQLGTRSVCLQMDVGFNSTRAARNACLAVGHEGQIMMTRIETKLPAARKELHLMKTSLHEVIKEFRVNVAAVVIDKNAANGALLRTLTQENNPNPQLRAKAVEEHNDVFHQVKTGGKHMEVFAKALKQELQAGCQQLHRSGRRVDGRVIGRLSLLVMQKFNEFFGPVEAVFASLDPRQWRNISESSASMLRFASDNGLLEEDVSDSFYQPLVDAWNGAASRDKQITSVRNFKPTSKSTKASLHAAVLALGTLKSIEDVPSIGTSKTQLVEFLQNHLPKLCFRGTLFSSTLPELSRFTVDGLGLPADGSVIDVDESERRRLEVIKTYFHDTQPTKAAIKKLKGPELDAIIADCMPVAEDASFRVPTALGDKRTYCCQHIYLLQDSFEDVTEALRLAEGAFNNRVSDYKRLLKGMLRIVNELYGGFGQTFKMYFVVRALRNFGKHSCGRHGDCNRYMWYARCSESAIYYTPSKQYVSEISSGRGPRCNALIGEFFDLFVVAWTLSKSVEASIWRMLSYMTTTCCENYFLGMAIAVPKSGKMPESEYRRREGWNFLNHTARCQQKTLTYKVLTANKNSSGLIAGRGQHIVAHEPHILEVMRTLFADDTSQAYVDVYSAKAKSSLARRQQKSRDAQARYGTDVIMSNLNMGPMKVEKQHDDAGILRHVQLPLLGPEISARPVPPFPFPVVQLLDDAGRDRLRQVWEISNKISADPKGAQGLAGADDATCEKCGVCDVLMNADTVACATCSDAIHFLCVNASSWLVVEPTGGEDETIYYCIDCTPL